MRTAIALFCVALLIGCGDVTPPRDDTKAPPAQPRPIEATQAEMEAGTETDPRTVSPLRVAQAVAALAGEGATEVVDAAVGAAGEDDTTHAYSKDNIYDYIAQNDADYDGLPSAVEAGAIDAIGEIDATLREGSDETLITGTAGTNTYTAVWNADGDLVDGYDPATKQDIPSEGAFADGDKTALDTIGGYVDQDVSSGSSPTLDGTNFSGIPIGGVADGVLVTEAEGIGSNDNDTTVPTSAAVKAYTDSVVTGTIDPVDTEDEDATFYPIIVDGATGSQATETDGEFTFNPSTGVLAATIFSGSGESLTWADGKLIDLSAITMSPGEDEGIALPAYADVAPDTEKNYAAYDAANNAIMVRESGGWVNASAGSGAATSLNFVTTQAEGSLSTESILSASSGGAGITVTDAGGDGGAITITLDTTEVDATTWSDNANASNVWTFDVSGTDHTMTAGDGVMTFGDAVTVTDTLTATNGIALGTSKSITGTTGLTVGGGTETIAINSSDWDIDATGVATGFGNITSDGTIVANAIDAPGDVDFDIGSEDVDDVTIITDGGTVIIDGQAIADNHLLSVDDAGAADGQVAVFTASGVEGHATVDDTELGYLNGVTAALSGFDSENEIEALIFDADDELVTGDWEWQDGVAASFGDDNDWEVAYDEAGDDALEFTGNNAAADTLVSISNPDGTYEANLEVEGDLDVGGAITAASIAADASSEPAWAAQDSDADAVGTFTFSIDAYTAGQDSQIIFKVDDSAGEDTTYATFDGSGEVIDFTKPVTMDSTLAVAGTVTIGTTGTIAEETDTMTFDDGDGDPITLNAIRTMVAGAEDNDLETDGAAGIANKEIFIGTGAGVGNYREVTGDATLANTGALAFAADSVDDAHINWAEAGLENSVEALIFDADAETVSGVWTFSATPILDDISVTDDILLSDGSVVGITGNEVITFNAAGSINVSGATMDVDGAFTASTVGSDGAVTATTSVAAPLFDAPGAEDLDIGSVDVTDVTIITDGGADSLTIGNNADLDFGITFDSDTDDATVNWDEDNSELEINAPNYRFGANADEDIVIVLDSDTNDLTLTWDEDNNKVKTGTAGLVTGFVDGGSQYTETDTDVDITIASTVNSHTYLNNHASTITYNLPAEPETVSGAGKIFCFRNLVAQAMTINPDDADYFNYNTDGAMDAGEALVSTGATGEFLCVMGMDDGSNDYWVTFGLSGTWAQETP